jgi:GntR family transcriptional regulator/MocR family aminotransferase
MPNVPDDRVLPWRIWQRLLVRHLRRSEPGWRDYTREGGHWPLRSVLADYLRLTRTVRCSPEQVIITGSTQHSLTLLAMALADPGAPAWVENPGYQGAFAAFEAAGLCVHPVPVDEQGLAWDGIARPCPSVIYVTPSHQYPLGAVMSLGRRRALLELAHTADAWVIEDDYDGEFRHEGRPIASLQGLDGGNRVIYLGTFSKALYPGIRVAYMVVPSALADPVRVLNARLFREGQHVEQAALADVTPEEVVR